MFGYLSNNCLWFNVVGKIDVEILCTMAFEVLHHLSERVRVSI